MTHGGDAARTVHHGLAARNGYVRARSSGVPRRCWSVYNVVGRCRCLSVPAPVKHEDLWLFFWCTEGLCKLYGLTNSIRQATVYGGQQSGLWAVYGGVQQGVQQVYGGLQQDVRRCTAGVRTVYGRYMTVYGGCSIRCTAGVQYTVCGSQEYGLRPPAYIYLYIR